MAALVDASVSQEDLRPTSTKPRRGRWTPRAERLTHTYSTTVRPTSTIPVEQKTKTLQRWTSRAEEHLVPRRTLLSKNMTAKVMFVGVRYDLMQGVPHRIACMPPLTKTAPEGRGRSETPGHPWGVVSGSP